MAFIEDIRVNGQQTSVTAPTIGGLHPTISWDYVEDVAAPGQLQIELRIGTSSVSLGFDGFNGNVLDSTIHTTANSYEHIEHSLSRGVVYYGQIRSTDIDGDVTIWTTFSFKTNQLPFVTSFKLSPSSPTLIENIDLTYVFQDADNHEEAGTKIRWFKNNFHQSTYDDLCTLPPGATSLSDSWTAKIIPSDGLEFGAIVETQAVVIQDTDIAFDQVLILPENANVDDILKVEFTLAETEYIQAVGVPVIEWYVNSVLVTDSNKEFIRLELDSGDIVYALVKLTDGDAVIAQAKSNKLTILDVKWYIYDLNVNGRRDNFALTDLTPFIDWKLHKTTAGLDERPKYIQVLVTKTPSRKQSVFDSGIVEYTKDSFSMPANVLKRGQDYYIHVGANDTTDINEDLFDRVSIGMAGSSWDNNVDNAKGWTIEFKAEGKIGLTIHDGTYWCNITINGVGITFMSNTATTVAFPAGSQQPPNTFRISAQGKNVKIFRDNKIIANLVGLFNHPSKLKSLEYGDFDNKRQHTIVIRFFRYTTQGSLDFEGNLPDKNTFLFSAIGKIEGGSLENINSNLIAWSPFDINKSSKLIEFNESGESLRLPTVSRNFSPITTIYIDEKRNKYIGTANGINAIFGERHDADYQFLTTDTNVKITPTDFDRISNVNASQLDSVEPDVKIGWFTLDTTYRAVGESFVSELTPTDDPYDPYISKFGLKSHAIHYYTQRTHGHSWYDNVDNKKGWQVTFSFDLDKIESDDFTEQNLKHDGFGIYINDGTYQEILYFYDDRIRLFYANIFISIVNTRERDFAIVGKDKNIHVYQKLHSTPVGSYALLLDGSGLFTTSASLGGNSRKPKIILDSTGKYHAVWHDDGNRRSQILYSSHGGEKWSNPELVTHSTQFHLKNPVLDIDSQGRIWIAYEDNSFGQTEISVSVKDGAGWNPKIRVTNAKSEKGKPSIEIDPSDDVHLVWEDNRNGHYEIFWALWTNKTQSWTSSNHFMGDTIVMQFDSRDPYQSDNVMEFRNPKLALLFPKIWLIAEGRQVNAHTSVIYKGFRNLELGEWITSGIASTDIDGNVIGFSSSTVSSSTEIDRVSLNPSVATNSTTNTLLISWEDQTEPVSQIWARAYKNSGATLVQATQLTSGATDSRSPSVGFSSGEGIILYENDFVINSIVYSSSSFSAPTALLLDSDKNASFPAMVPSSPTKTFKALYQFVADRTESSLKSIEFPNYELIGDVDIKRTTSTTTIGNDIVSNIDTKEFAFGDFSENVGILAHWRNIEMYFGYDARPYSISNFNTSNIFNWPDNRINDIFVDTFGNIIAATFAGLVYHNVFSGLSTIVEGHTSDFDPQLPCSQQPNECLLYKKLITAVAWGGNGIWYVGTTNGGFFSETAGKEWASLEGTEGKLINSMAVNAAGDGVFATTTGIVVKHPHRETVTITFAENETIDPNIRVVAVDDKNIIWAGSDQGLIRIENYTNFMTFNKKQGMRSSYVTDIAIVNAHLRYVGTVTGVERMSGSNFTNFNVNTHSILNDNISKLQWEERTQSLWVATLDALHEIVFRDPVHDIIEDEVEQYTNLDLSTKRIYDKNLFFVLDLDFLQVSEDIELMLNAESTNVFINRNKLGFGFAVDELAQSIVFNTDLLINDQVEIEVSNKFLQFHEFKQTGIEKKIVGEKRQIIKKFGVTSRRQTLLLSAGNKPAILLFGGEAGLPFTTIMIDRELPFGCLEQLEILSRTKIRFRLLAFDLASGLDGLILSNYPNFTTDGETPQEFQPITPTVIHDLGEELNNVFDSLIFPSQVTIDGVIHQVGKGSLLAKWEDLETHTIHMFAITSKPIIVFKYDPINDKWTAIQAIDDNDPEAVVNSVRGGVADSIVFNNVVYLTTGTDVPGGFGRIYRMADGREFTLVGGVTGNHARGIAGNADGIIFFGSSDGKIYQLDKGVLSVRFQNIGETIHSLDVFVNTMVVGTGNAGRVYTINLLTDDNLIIFDGPETAIERVHIKDSEIIFTPEEAKLFISANDSATIYRAVMSDLEFVKSFNSFAKNINVIKTVDTSVLIDIEEGEDPPSDIEETSTIASVGTDLFKFFPPRETSGKTWEFFYKHPEEIKDVVQYESLEQDGLWVISDTRITKRTNIFSKKTVYLKLIDKAGNESAPPNLDVTCPTETCKICCNFAYAINIADLSGFVNEARIIDIDEYGDITFTYDSPINRNFYSADQIDQEIGIYTSEVLNGSNDLVTWKTITWEAVEPAGTAVNVQVRNSATEIDIADEEWTPSLVKNAEGFVGIEHISEQYIQFRVILTSTVRGLSPSLSSVTLRNLTSQASHFFTTNFVMPSRPIKGIMTANTFIPVQSDIVFGISTKDSVDFGDYQLIEPNRLFTTSQGQFGTNLRIGAKLLSPGVTQILPSDNPGDPYDISSFICTVSFEFKNIDSASHDYHFRTRFYNDPFRTQLIHTFFTGNDQTGWKVASGNDNIFPATGLSILSGQKKSIIFEPLDMIEGDQRWYVTVEAFDGTNFETVSDNKSFVCSPCNVVNEPGLVAEYYKTGLPVLAEIPEFGPLTPDFTFVETVMNFPLIIDKEWTTTTGTVLTGYFQNYLARFKGRLQAPINGVYTFNLQSDDGSRLFIDGIEIIDHDGVHAFTIMTGSIELTSGFHDIEIHYFNADNSAGLELRWIEPGETDAFIVPPERLFHPVATEYCDDESPRIFNFAILFELENGEHLKLNLT